MKTLVITPTNTTPEVRFDNAQGYFEISGMSLPEDSFNFYKPVVEWMIHYAEQPAPKTELVFRMEYFNTSSTVYLLKLIKEVSRMIQRGELATVKWYHDLEDEDMSEAGRGLSMLANVPIELVGYQSTEI
jgi:hypothetical protein